MDIKRYAVYWIYANEFNSPMVVTVDARDTVSAKIAAQRVFEKDPFMIEHRPEGGILRNIVIDKITIIGAVLIV